MVESIPSDASRAAVEEEVERWGTNQRYMHHIAHLGSRIEDGAKHEIFRVKFSAPTKTEPIPLVTVDVYFYVIEGDDGVTGLYYHFEFEDLVLSRESTANVNNLRRIDRTMESKERTRSLLDLRTEFERTRVTKEGMKRPDEVGEVADEPTEEHGTSTPPTDSVSDASWGINIDTSGEGGEQSSLTVNGSTDASIMSRYPDSPKTKAAGNLEELFRHMFEAVDEDGLGVLTHKEVADILEATLGTQQRMKRWDVKIMLAAAEEGRDGRVAYKGLVDNATAFVTDTRRRRDARAEDEGKLSADSSEEDGPEFDEDGQLVAGKFREMLERVEQCFGSEIENTARHLMEMCVQYAKEREINQGPGGEEDQERTVEDKQPTIVLHRSELGHLLHSTEGRGVISPQEAVLLMQVIEEDEFGMMDVAAVRKHPTKNGGGTQAANRKTLHKFAAHNAPDVMIADLQWQLLAIRAQCLINSLIEGDPAAVHRRLVDGLRAGGLYWTNAIGEECPRCVPLWQLREVLLSIKGICLPRVVIRILLMSFRTNLHGLVEMVDFLTNTVSFVCWLFDTRPGGAFLKEAAKVSRLMEDEKANAEANELDMLMQSTVAANDRGGEEQHGTSGPHGVVDRETCEKQLVQLVTSYIWNEYGRGPVDVWHLQRAVMRHTDSAGGLTIAELRGLLGEVAFDPVTNKTLIPPVDHVRAWVPHYFRMKDAGLFYQPFMQGDLFPYIPKAEIASLDKEYPLFPPETPASTRRLSRRRSSLRLKRRSSTNSDRSHVSQRPSFLAPSMMSRMRKPSLAGSQRSSQAEPLPPEVLELQKRHTELVKKRREKRKTKREEAAAAAELAELPEDASGEDEKAAEEEADITEVADRSYHGFRRSAVPLLGASIQLHRYLYVFGGFDGEQCFDDLYKLDLDKLEWTRIEGHGDKPSGRASHTATSDELAGSMFVFGGSGSHFGYTNKCDLYEFAYDTSTWSLLCEVGISTNASPMRPTTPPNALGAEVSIDRPGGVGHVGMANPPLNSELQDAPTARYGQCMVQHHEQLYIWGGTHGTNYPTDMHRFDLVSKRWFGVIMNGEQPTGRYRHQALVRNDCMYVVGGSGTARYGDVFEFNFCTNTWRRLVCSGLDLFQQGRYAHAAVLHDSKVLVYGGNDGRRTNDLLTFDIDTQVWSQLPVHTLEAPPGRDFHAAVATAPQPIHSALSSPGPDSWYRLDRLAALCHRQIRIKLRPEFVVLILRDCYDTGIITPTTRSLVETCKYFFLNNYAECAALESCETLDPRLLCQLMRCTTQATQNPSHIAGGGRLNSPPRGSYLTDASADIHLAPGPGEEGSAAFTYQRRLPLAPISVEASSLHVDMEKLLIDDLEGDFEVVVQGVAFRCHSFVLAARCQYFSMLMQSGMSESQKNRLVMPEGTSSMTAAGFKTFLEYVYTGTTSMVPQTAIYLVDASDFYQLTNSRLRYFCEVALRQSFNERDVLDVFEASASLNVGPVRKMALDFIVEHFPAVGRQDKLASLDKPLLLEILRYLAEHQSANGMGASRSSNPPVGSSPEQPVIQSLG
ncbi:hypothetical protein FOL47_010737 [Perkinsus chesapeaki]|uniref:Kelch-like n=1 Tax=Perkinsus chesapeaki TaxID=330153 RepID=A0A7J6MPH8_PERCH|nr:hypothetical protein FOL47_010737 [Perkinsus chesapeaki]